MLPEVLAGRRIAALAITEPSGGSDVAALRTTAVRDGDHYVVNGEKTFITSGMRADYLTVAVRTDPGARGARGLSVLLVEGDTPGLSRTPLAKMGWWASDTAHLRFENCRVPAANLIGPEGAGFLAVMLNFNAERFTLAARRNRLCLGLLPGGARLGPRTPDVRQAAGRPPGGSPPAGGHADPHRGGARHAGRDRLAARPQPAG